MKINRFLLTLIFSIHGVLTAADAYSSPTLNFSPELLNAVEKCTPYQENISTQNPELSSYYAPELSKVSIQIFINIRGKDAQGNCQISFHQKIDKMGISGAECKITDEQREALLLGMKDRSGDEYSDTFIIQKGARNKNGEPIKITSKGSLLHVVYNKITNTSCNYQSQTASFPSSTSSPKPISPLESEVDELTPDKNISSDSAVATKDAPSEEKNIDNSEQETPSDAQEFVQYEVFDHDFMKSWQVCKPDVAEHDNNGNRQKVEILGVQNKRCQVNFADFSLNIPLEILPNIHSFVDLNALLKNKDIASYKHQPEYVYDGLIYALNACFNKKSYNGIENDSQSGPVVFHKGLRAEYHNQQCIILLQNEMDIDGSLTDYSVRCYLNDKVLQQLQPYFKDMIEKYGTKRMFSSNGRIEVHQAEFNEETHKGDIALMFYLQQHNYCKH